MNKREPTQITQGDTIEFTRCLPNQPATGGWSLLYALRGNGQAIEFTSTASGSDHAVLVPATTTELWLPADYQLEGWAVNTDGTRKQIYLAGLLITPDLATASPDVDVTTHAQRMLVLVEEQLEACAKNILLQTTVEGTTILRERRTELLMLRNRYIQERRGEIAAEKAKSGQPTGRKIRTIFAITQPSTARIIGAGNSVYNLSNP